MANNLTTIITSATKTVEINRANPTVIIGERINPTGRKAVLAALKEGNFEQVRQDALDQVAAGAPMLDVNAGVPGADEPALLQEVLRNVMAVTDVPLSIDTANPKALEAALQLYQGKPLVNSTNGEEKSLQAVLPLVKEYGAAVIGLCMDDNGIPPTPEARLAVAAKIIERAAKLGIPAEDVVIDPLVLTLGADSQAGLITLKTAELVVKEFGVNITMGASNVSFGLPDRRALNATFIAMAIHAGLTCPITNPLVEAVKTAVLAADLAMGRDDYGMRWIQDFRQRQKKVNAE
ncbi:MAG: 5-methyltetrahydrofolate:corrinoid/iron-sulfur protein co-methyltransferase [Anaerolineae bacterium]|nr:5-methyltetrahydrofolate:corrinoid/iron-sulfur protein co-methyltransferase [Anaerolineae bacterium]